MPLTPLLPDLGFLPHLGFLPAGVAPAARPLAAIAATLAALVATGLLGRRDRRLDAAPSSADDDTVPFD